MQNFSVRSIRVENAAVCSVMIGDVRCTINDNEIELEWLDAKGNIRPNGFKLVACASREAADLALNKGRTAYCARQSQPVKAYAAFFQAILGYSVK